MELKNKLVVVTGAGSGIGRALAQRFAECGARKVVCTDLNEESVAETASLIGGVATPETLDVSSQEAIDSLVARMEDEGGIDMSVLLPIDYDFSWGSESEISIEEKHEHQAQMVAKYPGRFISFGGPDPRRAGAKEIFKRAITQHGAKGLKIIPKNGYYPWQEECYELYDVCMEYGVPMYSCTEPEPGGYNRGRFSDPLDLLDVVGDYPDMPLTLLHAGNPLYDYFEKSLFVASGNHNTSIELNYWLKPGAGVAEASTAPIYGLPLGNNVLTEETAVMMLARARDILGAHKISWGIDIHFGPKMKNSGWKLAEWLRGLEETAAKYGQKFTQEEIDLILGENVARTLGIKEYPEWDRPAKYGYTRRVPRPRYH